MNPEKRALAQRFRLELDAARRNGWIVDQARLYLDCGLSQTRVGGGLTVGDLSRLIDFALDEDAEP